MNDKHSNLNSCKNKIDRRVKYARIDCLLYEKESSLMLQSNLILSTSYYIAKNKWFLVCFDCHFLRERESPQLSIFSFEKLGGGEEYFVRSLGAGREERSSLKINLNYYNLQDYR